MPILWKEELEMQFKAFERKASRLAGQVAQKGSELLDAGKTKLAIGKEEHAIDELYYKIGEAVYRQAKKDGAVPDYIAADIAEIDVRKRRVDELRTAVKQEAAASDTDPGQDEIIIDITAEPDEQGKKEERE